MSSRRSPFLGVLFALLLLFAQQHAALHALGHDFERIHAAGKDGTSHNEAFCVECVAVAHLDHADGAVVTDLPATAYAPPRVERARHDGERATFAAVYRSRAPPLFS